MKWQATIINWVVEGIKAGRKVLIVYYEDIKKDSKAATKQMLNFVGMDVVNTVEETDDGKFHRQHKSADTFDPFTQQQRQFVMSTIQDTIDKVESNGLSSKIDLRKYL